MTKLKWLLAVPLLVAFGGAPVRAATIRDEAGLFSRDVVREAEARIERIEEGTRPRMSITIETIDSLDGQTIDAATTRHAERSGTHGIYILIAKQEQKIDVKSSAAYRDAFPDSRRRRIYDAFVPAFKRKDFDAGLKDGVRALETEVNAAKAENGGVLTRHMTAPVGGVRRVPMRGRPAFGIGSLLGIGLAVLAILFVLRLIGSAIGGGAGAYGGPGRMMGGPGYGGPGYGGGGGGFWSSMLGGIGGAMAGNWLYDQFSGRHHGGYVDNSSYNDGTSDVASTGNDDWSGGDTSGDWGGGGDGGGGGGDWGGGDGGGGGGGDWGGGGGGDWGGGGGGGDW